jgi:hypothetical protein
LTGLVPLPVPVDELDDGNGNVEQFARQAGYAIERLLARRVEDIQIFKRTQTRRLPLVAGGVRSI